LIAFLLSKLGKMFASALAVLSVVVAIFVAGRKDAKKDRKLSDLQGKVDAQERINETTITTDRNAALERLRKHNNLRD
jgi:hypothetical protein